MAKKRLFDLKSVYDANIDINKHVVKILAAASAIANSIGFLANFFLYGVNLPTIFCGVCAVLCWIHLIFGVKSEKYMLWGSIHLVVLCILEFPLLVFAYGPVMYPYMILGYMGVLMLTGGKARIRMCACLVIFDLVVIVLSSINPYIFGPQDSVGLMGSALVTFLVTIISFSVCIIVWQNVYVRRSSDVDPETGVLSQNGFVRELSQAIHNAPPGKYAVLYFNIVSFKAVNAVHGISGGNQVLKQLAARLRDSSMLKPLCVCRHVADHFYLLAEENNIDYNKLPQFCQFKYRTKNMNLSLQLNCGIYVIDDPSMDTTSICDRAKAVTAYSPMIRSHHYAVFDKKMEETFNKENEILALVEDAVNNQEFEPYYQPIVNCKTGEIVSAEALARWIRPDNTVVPPGVFIPILEKKEMISELDYTIALKVSRFLETRRARGQAVCPVSINLSRVDLYNDTLMNNLRAMVKKTCLEGSFYRFEITESAYESISDSIAEIIAKLRELGSYILVDDFGSGYSSLGTIDSMDFDIIKLDMSFARKIEINPRTCILIKTIINTAHDLGVTVTAEGVETEAQLSFLRQAGCDYIQGYYFYKPMPENEYAALLDSLNKQ